MRIYVYTIAAVLCNYLHVNVHYDDCNQMHVTLYNMYQIGPQSNIIVVVVVVVVVVEAAWSTRVVYKQAK